MAGRRKRTVGRKPSSVERVEPVSRGRGAAVAPKSRYAVTRGPNTAKIKAAADAKAAKEAKAAADKKLRIRLLRIRKLLIRKLLIRKLRIRKLRIRPRKRQQIKRLQMKD